MAVRKMSGIPRRRDREESTRTLLEAGIDAFAENGYDAATTKDIAQRAGLNEQLITRYFGGKAGLLVAIYEDFLRRQEDVLTYAASRPQDSAHAEIERFLLAKHAHFRETAKLVTILVPRLLIDADVRTKMDMTLLDRATTILADRLAVLQANGKVQSDCDVVALSHSIAFVSFGISFLRPTVRGTLDEQAIAHLRAFALAISQGIEVA